MYSVFIEVQCLGSSSVRGCARSTQLRLKVPLRDPYDNQGYPEGKLQILKDDVRNLMRDAGWLWGKSRDHFVCGECSSEGDDPDAHGTVNAPTRRVVADVLNDLVRAERNRCAKLVGDAADRARGSNRGKVAAELDLLARDIMEGL